MQVLSIIINTSLILIRYIQNLFNFEDQELKNRNLVYEI